jgi:hypothetical protein
VERRNFLWKGKEKRVINSSGGFEGAVSSPSTSLREGSRGTRLPDCANPALRVPGFLVSPFAA